MTTPARGMVVLMMAPSAVRSTCLTVSMAGHPAMAAPCFCGGGDDVVNGFGSDEGADGVVDQDKIVWTHGAGMGRDFCLYLCQGVGDGVLAVLAALD